MLELDVVYLTLVALLSRALVDAEASNHGPVNDPTVLSVRAPAQLYCQHVIFAPLRRHFKSKMDKVFSKVLLKAISLQAHSLVMPPLGTGGFRLSVHECADAMRKAFERIHDFGSLTEVVIVDRAHHLIDHIRNILVQMAVEELVNQDANDSGVQSPSTSNPVASLPNVDPNLDLASPFSMFYTFQTQEQLDEMKEKRLVEMTENHQNDDIIEGCPICLLDMCDGDPINVGGANGVVKLNRCPHYFHRNCIIQWFSTKPQCPACNTWYMLTQGNQPGDGRMDIEVVSRGRLEGMSDVRGYIRIKYYFPSGIQSHAHPRPGVPYHGMTRTCYLPNTDDGHEVADLLQLAFERRLVFTVGDSVTTGQRNVIVWNGIHHKTSRQGGPTNFGYPDPTYLDRVRRELAAVGITEDTLEQQNNLDVSF
ncbi:unnamed protein product [Bursaphelenchus okinawaensis]|uniref:E3 ubiquitin-protein ligase n=1 Tax=Bursaphelenchus okinawaensis TaxID=465554 RepID=A0A811LNU0_9BILA|nr:unnamed protein product [Bursaphelenchus okinawaensis]CAG9125795.1 unnamed protein product [Bursaphelenchus okinawaensis]